MKQPVSKYPTYSITVIRQISKELFIVGCFSDDCYGSDHCIKDVVRRIVDAQVKAAEEAATSCMTSCEQSIEDLLSPTKPGRRSRHTTIPIMLTDKNGKPFVGSGFVGRDKHGERTGYFDCIESPVFKVRGFVRGTNNCVRLELLLPVGRRHSGPDPGGEGKGDGAHSHHGKHGGGSFCDKFGGRRIENFRETGLCITVDLDCFCGITCLDPITPVRR